MEPSLPDETIQPQIIYIKRLVTALSTVLIAGFLVLIVALVIRLNADPLPLPERVSLPEGVSAVAFTQGIDWFAVVTSDDRILIFDRTTGELRQTVVLEN